MPKATRRKGISSKNYYNPLRPIKRLDLFGEPVNLMHRGERTIKSYFGAIITVVIIGLTAMYALA